MTGSDFPEGPDWIKAADGRWYPPNVDPATEGSKRTGTGDPSAAQGCLGAVILVVVVGIVLAILGVGTGDDGPSEYGARDVCEQSVRDQLLTPSSASFGGHQTTRNGSEFRVTGHVDADNAFGATLRSRWTCTARHVEGERWNVSASLLD